MSALLFFQAPKYFELYLTQADMAVNCANMVTGRPQAPSDVSRLLLHTLAVLLSRE